MRIEFKSVDFSYLNGSSPNAESEVLNDFSFAFGGGITTIIGPSGSGKSTLLGLIANILTPQRGRVLIEGFEFKKKWPAVGIVSQAPALLPWRTVLQNAVFGAEISGTRTREDIQGEAAEFLARHGLSRFLHSLPRELSGGMQQRLSVARAIISGARVILLDESFSNLDAAAKQALQIEVSNYIDDTGSLAVFVTHDLEDAVRLGDRVVVIDKQPLAVINSIDLPGLRSDRLIADNMSIAPLVQRVWLSVNKHLT